VGPDKPKEGRTLTALVNDAIDDILAWPFPYDGARLRQRLRKLLDDADPFATEDRDQIYRYVVRIWRTADFAEDSGLFPVPDDSVLRNSK
jgi:hypothetical protein